MGKIGGINFLDRERAGETKSDSNFKESKGTKTKTDGNRFRA